MAIVLLTIGGILNIQIVDIFFKIFFISIALYWAYSFFYPIKRKEMDSFGLSSLLEPNVTIKEGIAICTDTKKLEGLNKKYQGMYDKLAPFYDLFQAFVYIFWGGEKKVRMEYLKELPVKDKDKVLEVSVGTGGNLHFLLPEAIYYGLDISWGMLKQCQKNLSRWHREAYLFLGEAEKLPFEDNTFDVVFHTGGINFFNDKKKAIDEMIRVAQSGARILIADETEEVAKGTKQIPGVKDFYNQKKELYRAPVDLIPKAMKNIKVQNILEGNLFCITFNKP